MQTIQLKFHSMQDLWRFKEAVQLANFEVNPSENILCCQLSPAALNLAVNQFGARRVDQLHEA